MVLPPGAGISEKTADHARIVAMLRRVAMVELSFAVSGEGRAADVQVESSSGSAWEAEAASVLARWEFAPRRGAAEKDRCRVLLAWVRETSPSTCCANCCRAKRNSTEGPLRIRVGR